jgi:hypothetical protein
MFRFFLASEVSFLQSLGIVSWSFVALGLIQTPVMLAILTLKGDWNIDPNEVIQANPMIFFEASDLPRWLGALLSSLDLFSLWTIFLLGTGYATAGTAAPVHRALGSGHSLGSPRDAEGRVPPDIRLRSPRPYNLAFHVRDRGRRRSRGKSGERASGADGREHRPSRSR